MDDNGKTDLENADYLYRVNQEFDSLTKTQRKIATYLKDHETDIINHSITVLAKKIGTTPAALSRFAQAIHYKGFSDLRFCLEKKFISSFLVPEPVHKSDDIAEIKRKYLALYTATLTETLMNLNTKSIRTAAESIIKARHTYIYASGTSGASATLYFQLLLQIGISCNYFTDKQLALIGAGQLTEGDVALGINYSGNSQTITEAFKIAKQNGATIIAITADAQSNIAKLADIQLCYSSKIPDDIRHMHIARINELSILGILQSVLTSDFENKLRENLLISKQAIIDSRRK